MASVVVAAYALSTGLLKAHLQTPADYNEVWI